MITTVEQYKMFTNKTLCCFSVKAAPRVLVYLQKGEMFEYQVFFMCKNVHWSVSQSMYVAIALFKAEYP